MALDLKPLAYIEDISQSWIEAMLTLKYGVAVTVQSWSYRLPEGREGFMSDIAYLTVSCSTAVGQQKDLRLVLKVLPENEERREFMIRGGLDKREIHFYKFIMSSEFQDICTKNNLVLPMPEVYYADCAENAVTLIMGDLSVEKYKSVLIKEGSTLSQTKVAFQAIAKIHAAGMIYLKKYGESNESIVEIASEFDNDFYDEFFVPNLERMVKMNKDTPLEDIVKSLIPKTKPMIYLRKRYPLLRTIAHGDFWAGQLLYSDDERKAIVIDWQYCSLNNAVSDIQSMFFMSCEPEILDHHLDEVLRAYWDSLTEAMHAATVPLDVTYDQFKENVEDLWLYGFMMISISIHDFLGEGNLTRERLQGYIDFLHRKGIFTDFIKMIENEEKAAK